MAQLNDKNFPDDLHYELKVRASETRTTMRQLVIELLTEGLARTDPYKPSNPGRAAKKK